ncbi:MAG: hypothetical protein HYY84_18025 [Deltaproteobacteria bacterium]|nr:hypothetical protein [Deltaproteobacteria bacterium]
MKYRSGWLVFSGLFVLAWAGVAGAASLDALKPFCPSATDANGVTNENKLIQCGTANIRSQCQGVIGEVGRNEGTTGAATQHLGKAYFHADKCVKRSDVNTGNFSWLEALNNLWAAQSALKSAKAAGLKPRVARHDEGVDFKDSTVPIFKDPAKQLQAMKVFCDALRVQLSGVVTNPNYPKLIPEHRAVVDQARATAATRLDQCDNAVKQKWADAIGMANEAASAVATALRALVSKQLKDEKKAKDDAQKQELADLRRKIAEARVRLEVVYTSINTLRNEAKKCMFLAGNQRSDYNESDFSCGAGTDVKTATGELRCIEKQITHAEGLVEETKESIPKSKMRDIDDAKKKAACAIDNLIGATVDKVCEAFETVCKIVKDGKACYRQAGDAVFSTVKDLERIASVPWTLSGLRGLADDVGKLESAVKECWAWVNRSVDKVVEKVKEALCAEPRGSLGKTWCPVLEQAAECYRDAMNAGVTKHALAALERFASGAESATEAFVSATDVGSVKKAIASCKDALTKAKKAGKKTIDDATEWAGKIRECLKDTEKCGKDWAWQALQDNVPEGATRTFSVEGSGVGSLDGLVAGVRSTATGSATRNGAGFTVEVRIEDEIKGGVGTLKVHGKAGYSSARTYTGNLSSPDDVFPFAGLFAHLLTDQAVLTTLDRLGIPSELAAKVLNPVQRWLNMSPTADVIKRLVKRGILVAVGSEFCLVADGSADSEVIKDVLSLSGAVGAGQCGSFSVGVDGKVTFGVGLKRSVSGGVGLTIAKVLGASGQVSVEGSINGKITVDCGIKADEDWSTVKMATVGLKKCLKADRPYTLGIEVSASGTVEGVAGPTLEAGKASISGSLGKVAGVTFKASLASGVSKKGLKTLLKSLDPEKFLGAGGWSGAGAWTIDLMYGSKASGGIGEDEKGAGFRLGIAGTNTLTCNAFCSGGFQIEGVRSLLAGGPLVSYTGGCKRRFAEAFEQCGKGGTAKTGGGPPAVTPVGPVEPVEPVTPVRPKPPVVGPGSCSGKMNPNLMSAIECTATGWGKSVCTRLVKERERGARYRDLDDMTKVVRKAFGADVEKCAIKKGRTFLNWAWPAARCEKGRGQPSCKKPAVHLCQNQMSRATQSCTAPRPLTIRPIGGGQTGAGTKTTDEPPTTPSGTESGGATETAGEVGYLTGDGIYLRKEPSKTAGIHVMLFKRPCKEFKVLEKSVAGGGLTWTKIEWQGKVGYIASQHVAFGSCPAR